ncbi:Fe(3+)-hydroxamate ABC transporter permease FhuB [Pararobbsia silviterrae]|nr:Fe(3+)-hydroxamate ABC transporter permease FhuB [Pararobbsia silviterrae]
MNANTRLPHAPAAHLVQGHARPWRLPAALFAATGVLALYSLSLTLPVSEWFSPHAASPVATIHALVALYAWLPRLAISILAGLALGLASTIFQQVLRNPLAEPLTLGVSAGANLALTSMAIWAPAALASARFGIAFGGAACAMFVTLAMTRRKRFAPVPVALAGMIVNLYCGAVALVLTIAHERTLVAIFIWGAGSLSQNGWSGVAWMLPQVAFGIACAAWLVRPLTLFTLHDEGANQLGLRVVCTRPLALAVAVALSASVVSTVGVIGFVGLAAPALARLNGARRLRDQLVWAPLTCAGLLALTDQVVQCIPDIAGATLPAGAATALFGAPLLLWLMHRARADRGRTVSSEPSVSQRCSAVIPVLLGVLAIETIVSLCFAQTLDGWHWTPIHELTSVAYWRVPRMVASCGAGIMLAVSGALLQRLSGNPMASPELLGVSGAAMLGVLVATMVTSTLSTGGLVSASLAGSLCGLVALIVFARRSRFSAQPMLLAGVALAALSQSAIGIVMAHGSAYASLLRSLTMGSTYLIEPALASCVALAAVLALVAAASCARWLDILPLGTTIADGLGVNSRRAQGVLLVIAALATAGATIVVGPLSFVGLLAPHIARLIGLSKARSQLIGAALIGAVIMVFADWAGRNMIFPQQLPSGLLASLIGGPYLVWLLRR